ncbi:MAG: SAM-dependent methyltransferase [Fluviicola sp.]|nr:MAG: SAM-dependent methyltransferase [Fluviicola sp.]
MANKIEMNLSTKELEEIEKQLRCPTGENGVEIANNMNVSNLSMTLASIELLKLKRNERILEIGHGNCGHLKFILEEAPELSYVGLEISETMQKEAKRINANHRADFLLYDGHTIPFDENSFNKVISVNTLYFWNDAIGFLKEIERVLQVDGVFILTFALKSFMQKLPFVKSEFNLYNEPELRELISSSNLEIDTITHKKERAQSKSGEIVNREFLIARIIKRA